MTYDPQPLDTLSKRIRAAIRLYLPGTDALVWPNTLGVLQKVLAASIHEAELRAQWLFRQILASTADAAHLDRHGYEYGIARKPASRATGLIETTGQANTIYPAGVTYYSAGAEYQSSGEAKADSGGALTIPVNAIEPGAAGNREEGDDFVLVDTALYPTLSSEATAAAGGIGGGADRESDDSLRARILDRKRRPPQGGAESDYEQWTLAIPGVTKAWARRFENGPGTVGVWFLFAGRANGIPTAADVALVQDTLDRKRLIRARIVVNAPIPFPIDIRIAGLSDDTAKTRAAIADSLAAMFTERAEVGAAVQPYRFSISWISEAISQAIGEDAHQLVYPIGDYVKNDGTIPVLGTITYE